MNSDNPFDLDEASTDSKGSTDELDDTALAEPKLEVEPKTPKKKAEPKATRKRRSQAEIEAEAIEDAKTLLKANGFVVSNVADPGEGGGFQPVKLPVDAHSNDIVGSLKTNAAGVVILSVSPRRWVGEPPLVLQAAQLDDVVAVLTKLRAATLEH